MATTQSTFDPEWNRELERRSHLAMEKPDSASATEQVHAGRREAYCTECERRVTITPDGKELGHSRGVRVGDELCPHHCYNGGLS